MANSYKENPAQPILGQPLPKRMASPLVLGLAAFRIWFFLVSFSTVLFVNVGDPKAALNSTLIVMLAAEIALLALVSVAHARVAALFHRSKPLGLIAPLIMVAGTLCFVSAGYGPIDEKALVIVGSALNGIGAGFSLLVWGEAYSVKQTHTVAMGSICAYLISGIGAAILLLMPVVVSLSAAFVLPFLSASAALKCRPHAEKETLPKPRLDSPRLLLTKIGIAAGVFGLSSGIVGQTSSKQITLGLQGLDVLGLPLATVVAALVVLALFKIAHSITFDGLYRTGLILVVISLLMPALFGGDNTVASFFATMGKCCIELMIWILVCTLVHRYGLESFFAISISQGFDSFGLLLGAIAGLIMPLTDTMSYAMFGIIVIVLIILAYSTALNEREIEVLTTEDAPLTREQRCTIVGRAYGLSPREIEILVELAAGHSNARICNDLVISKGTLNTHLYKIYGKLDAHSRQDVSTLIEEADLDALAKRAARNDE